MVNQQCEQQDQTRIVELMSEEFHVSIDEIATFYEREKVLLADGPHVPNFLHVFAIRTVREMLRSRHEQANSDGVETLHDPAGAEGHDTVVIAESRRDLRAGVEHALAA